MNEESVEAIAERLAARGHEALVERLRVAFTEAAAAHADLVQIDGEKLEALVQSSAEQADGLQWRRALATIAAEELGIPVTEALAHPAVARAQELVGAPSYEESLATLIRRPVPASGEAPPAVDGTPETNESAVAGEEGSAGEMDGLDETEGAGEPDILGESEPAAESEPGGEFEPAGESEPGGESEGAGELGAVDEAEMTPDADAAGFDLDTEGAAGVTAGGGAESELIGDATEAEREPAWSDAEAEAAAETGWASPTEAAPPPEAADGEQEAQGEPADAGAEAEDGQETLRVSAVHLGGVANLPTDNYIVDLRLSDVGLDILREEDEIIGRLAWADIEALEVPATRGRLRRRGQPRAQLIVRTASGDASFEVPAFTSDDLRARVELVVERFGRS